MNADAGRHPLGIERTEQPVAGRGAEHGVDAAAAGAQRVGQQEQRRGAVAAADQHAVGGLARQRERPAERTDDVDRVVRPAAGRATAVPLPVTEKMNSTVPP